MKTKVITIIVLAGFLLSSCSSTYFYSTLETTNYEVEKVENGDFLFENDSLWIAHSFRGEDAPIQITIFNKLDIPLYVDWSKSALILDKVAHPYHNGTSQIRATTESTSYHGAYSGTSTTYGHMGGTIHNPQFVNIIPPQTMVSRSTLRLAARFDELEKSKFTKGKLQANDESAHNVEKINFNLNDTPLRFGSYVNVFTKPDEMVSYTTDFYVTNVIKTKAKPNQLPSNMADRGDTFYQHIRPDNTGWEILGVTAVVAGVVAVDVMTSKHNYDYHHHDHRNNRRR